MAVGNYLYERMAVVESNTAESRIFCLTAGIEVTVSNLTHPPIPKLFSLHIGASSGWLCIRFAMNALNQQFDNPSPPATVVAESTPTILSTLEDEINVNTIKDQLRDAWQRGGEWRLEFGRLLIKFREVARHGEWIKFLEAEFGLHRMTAHRWMQKAAEADGIDITEMEEREEVAPDEYAEELEERIADEAAERDLAKKAESRNFKMVVTSVTPEEIADYKKQLKAENEWARSVLRRAFDEIRAGRPVVVRDENYVRKTLDNLLPDEEPEYVTA
jgi:transposase-like protein